MVEDSSGIIHAFWWDEFDGNMYSRLVGDQRSMPIQIAVPFGEFIPVLVADSNGYLHAFWIDENQVLYYANVNVDSVPGSEWNLVVLLADSAIRIDLEIDKQDRLHLAYLRAADTPEAPAGFYYRKSAPGGNDWLDPILIYQSPYLRKLAPDEAHVDTRITYSGVEQHIYLAWDNPLRGQSFLVKSVDGGETWGEPIEVGEPEEVLGEARPSHLIIYAQAEEVLLLWQTGSSETGCTPYYQWSLDGGESWQPRQRMSRSLFGCPERMEILAGADGPILVRVSSQVYLQAWDSTRWSDPQLQGTLASFIDSETQRTVTLGCLQVALLEGRSLIFIACDTSGGGDIWFLRRELDDVDNWFPHESPWQTLTSVTRNEARFLSLEMIADTEGRVHVFWAQSSESNSSRPASSLYYTRLEDERLWSQPVAVLTSPEQPVDQPAVALDSAERLLMTWRCGEQAEICFSRVGANTATLSSAWSEPIRVSAPGHRSSAPDIVVGSQGAIYIVYAVPVNEGRGIYLTHSDDYGETWSEPIQIFDGASTSWAMLDQPRLALTSAGDLHLLWTHYNLRSGEAEPVALSYVRSQDGGKAWSESETVTESSVVWARVLSTVNGSVYRFWQEGNVGRFSLEHERSLDNGATWERAEQIAFLGDTIATPTLSKDLAGNFHLLQLITQGPDDLSLQHRVWDGERWLSSDSLDLDLDSETDVGGLVSAASPRGNLVAVFSTWSDDPSSGSGEELFFTTRSIEPPEGLPTPLPPASVTPVVTENPTLEPTAEPTLTPTPDLTALGSAGNAGSSWDGLVIGAILAGAIVTVAFGFGVWKARGGGNNRG
ncbi:MAG: sialidase family protein [Anaerolineales bacterium]